MCESRRDRLTVECDQLCCKTAGSGDGDLLTENRAYRQLKSIPSAGSAQARTHGYEGSKERITCKMSIDGFDVGAEIEEPTHAADNGGQGFDFRKTDGDSEALLTRQVRYFDAADGSVDFDSAPIDSGLDPFHAGNGPCFKKGKHRLPIVGRAIAQSQRDLCFGCA